MFKSAHHRNEKQYSLLKTHSIKKKPRFSLEKRALRKAFGIFFLRQSLKRTRFNAFKKVRLKSSENVLIGKRRVETLFCTIFFFVGRKFHDNRFIFSRVIVYTSGRTSSVTYPRFWRCHRISRGRCRVSSGRRSTHTRQMRSFTTGDVRSPLEMRIPHTHTCISRARCRIFRRRCGGISKILDM